MLAYPIAKAEHFIVENYSCAVQSKTTGQYLSTDDLSAVTTAVWHARVKWRAIGLQLGIPPGDLDAIGERHRDNSDACLPDMLTKFLQKVSPKQPTWSRLADAMASTVVGRGDIAKKLRRMN